MSESWLRKKFDSCAPGRVVGREVGGVLETSEHGASIETIRVCVIIVCECVEVARLVSMDVYAGGEEVEACGSLWS